jgi:hypothetical protein
LSEAAHGFCPNPKLAPLKPFVEVFFGFRGTTHLHHGIGRDSKL